LLAIVIAAVLANAPAIANASVSYQSKDSTEGDPRLLSLGEYVQGSVIEASLLGVELRDDQRKLKSGAFANGLLIVAVAKGGPAANAGLEALQEMPKQVLAGLAVTGSMVFPPAIILLPVLASLPIGRDGDLIIAVDGSRVSNVLDFEDDIRGAQPGEIVYLTILRAGRSTAGASPYPGNCTLRVLGRFVQFYAPSAAYWLSRHGGQLQECLNFTGILKRNSHRNGAVPIKLWP
jgi:S1-C subfamily serine protease